MANGGSEKNELSLTALLAFLAGIAALAALCVAAWGYREGHWDVMTALLKISQYAAWGGVAAVVLGLVGIGATLPGGARRGRILSIVGVLAGGGAAGFFGYQYYGVITNPFIHDISTDLEDPPAFQALLAVRADDGASNPPEHPGAEVALQQRAGYPEIAPLRAAANPAEAFAKALSIAEEAGWEIVSSDRNAFRIEAVATSRFYGFKDDIVIRVSPRANGSLVDMRSKSRVGRSDVGVNAARIAAFMGKLGDSAGVVEPPPVGEAVDDNAESEAAAARPETP